MSLIFRIFSYKLKISGEKETLKLLYILLLSSVFHFAFFALCSLLLTKQVKMKNVIYGSVPAYPRSVQKIPFNKTWPSCESFPRFKLQFYLFDAIC